MSAELPTELTENPTRAAEILRRGGIVAVPTETVYGLAACYDNPRAIAQIFAAKQRPSDNPLIVHLADQSWLPQVARHIPPLVEKLFNHFAPGPLTLTLPRANTVPDAVTAGLDSVAVRIPAAPICQQLLKTLGKPIVAPSANLSGRPSPTRYQDVYEELYGRIDAVLMGPPCQIGLESTVVDCCQSPPYLLRPGAVTLEQIQQFVPQIQLLPATASVAEVSTVNPLPSPGLRHKHYAPTAQVQLFDDPTQLAANKFAMYLGLQQHPHADAWGAHANYPTTEQYAHALFEMFRRADSAKLQLIYCQRVPTSGLGRALMDRLQRAAAASTSQDEMSHSSSK